jgi:hypothetical protein
MRIRSSPVTDPEHRWRQSLIRIRIVLALRIRIHTEAFVWIETYRTDFYVPYIRIRTPNYKNLLLTLLKIILNPFVY